MGRSTLQNPEQACAWLSKAADQDHVPAHRQLARMYREGGHVEKNDEKAKHPFKRALLCELRRPDTEYLDLTDYEIDDDTVLEISSRLQGRKLLKTLNLNNNNVGDRSATELAGPVEQNPVWEVLALRENPIGYSGVKALAEAMSRNTTMEAVSLTPEGEPDTPMRLLQERIAAECRVNMRIVAMLERQQSWQPPGTEDWSWFKSKWHRCSNKA